MFFITIYKSLSCVSTTQKLLSLTILLVYLKESQTNFKLVFKEFLLSLFYFSNDANFIFLFKVNEKNSGRNLTSS